MSSQAPPIGLEIRPARAGDIYAILAVHREAFSDKFGAAFGGDLDRGLEAMAEAWRRQGPSALRGMLLAAVDGQIVGTASLRTSDMGFDTGGAAELAFHHVLGSWGALRSIFALSLLEHSVERYEGYITDVAVLSSHRRQGIAGALLARVEADARARGRRYLGLYVSSANSGARALYRRCGFADLRVRRSLMAWALLRQRDWIYMRKDLPPEEPA